MVVLVGTLLVFDYANAEHGEIRFTSGAVAMAQQALDQLPKLLVLGLQLGDCLPQHLLQDIRIVRQCREIDLHNTMMMTHALASPPITPA